MRKIKNLFFDLDNTLWDFDKNARLALEIAFRKFALGKNGLNFEVFAETYFAINEQLWDDYRERKVTKPQLIEERFKKTFEKTGIAGVNPLDFNECYLSEMPKQTNLVEGVAEILEYLYGKKYNLFIITNGFKEVQELKLELSGISRYFKKVFISEEIKSPKPDREFFEYALKSTNSKKSESLVIGDSWEADIEGARNCGISQVYFKPSGIADDSGLGDDGIFTQKIFTCMVKSMGQLKKIL